MQRLADGEALVDDLVLRDVADVGAARRDRLAVDRHVARRGLRHAGERLQQRALARAALADDPDELARLDAEADVGEDLPLADADDEPVRVEAQRAAIVAGEDRPAVEDEAVGADADHGRRPTARPTSRAGRSGACRCGSAGRAARSRRRSRGAPRRAGARRSGRRGRGRCPRRGRCAGARRAAPWRAPRSAPPRRARPSGSRRRPGSAGRARRSRSRRPSSGPASAPCRRSPLTRVPFLEPRSATAQPPEAGRIAACSRDTPPSGRTRSLEGTRPIVRPADESGQAASVVDERRRLRRALWLGRRRRDAHRREGTWGARRAARRTDGWHGPPRAGYGGAVAIRGQVPRDAAWSDLRPAHRSDCRGAWRADGRARPLVRAAPRRPEGLPPARDRSAPPPPASPSTTRARSTARG